jgi:hypothetical protein
MGASEALQESAEFRSALDDIFKAMYNFEPGKMTAPELREYIAQEDGAAAVDGIPVIDLTDVGDKPKTDTSAEELTKKTSAAIRQAEDEQTKKVDEMLDRLKVILDDALAGNQGTKDLADINAFDPNSSDARRTALLNSSAFLSSLLYLNGEKEAARKTQVVGETIASIDRHIEILVGLGAAGAMSLTGIGAVAGIASAALTIATAFGEQGLSEAEILRFQLSELGTRIEQLGRIVQDGFLSIDRRLVSVADIMVANFEILAGDISDIKSATSQIQKQTQELMRQITWLDISISEQLHALAQLNIGLASQCNDVQSVVARRAERYPRSWAECAKVLTTVVIPSLSNPVFAGTGLGSRPFDEGIGALGFGHFGNERTNTTMVPSRMQLLVDLASDIRRRGGGTTVALPPSGVPNIEAWLSFSSWYTSLAVAIEPERIRIAKETASILPSWGDQTSPLGSEDSLRYTQEVNQSILPILQFVDAIRPNERNFYGKMRNEIWNSQSQMLETLELIQLQYENIVLGGLTLEDLDNVTSKVDKSDRDISLSRLRSLKPGFASKVASGNVRVPSCDEGFVELNIRADALPDIEPLDIAIDRLLQGLEKIDATIKPFQICHRSEWRPTKYWYQFNDNGTRIWLYTDKKPVVVLETQLDGKPWARWRYEGQEVRCWGREWGIYGADQIVRTRNGETLGKYWAEQGGFPSFQWKGEGTGIIDDGGPDQENEACRSVDSVVQGNPKNLEQVELAMSEREALVGTHDEREKKLQLLVARVNKMLHSWVFAHVIKPTPRMGVFPTLSDQEAAFLDEVLGEPRAYFESSAKRLHEMRGLLISLAQFGWPDLLNCGQRNVGSYCDDMTPLMTGLFGKPGTFTSPSGRFLDPWMMSVLAGTAPVEIASRPSDWVEGFCSGNITPKPSITKETIGEALCVARESFDTLNSTASTALGSGRGTVDANEVVESYSDLRSRWGELQAQALVDQSATMIRFRSIVNDIDTVFSGSSPQEPRDGVQGESQETKVQVESQETKMKAAFDGLFKTADRFLQYQEDVIFNQTLADTQRDLIMLELIQQYDAEGGIGRDPMAR